MREKKAASRQRREKIWNAGRRRGRACARRRRRRRRHRRPRARKTATHSALRSVWAGVARNTATAASTAKSTATNGCSAPLSVASHVQPTAAAAVASDTAAAAISRAAWRNQSRARGGGGAGTQGRQEPARQPERAGAATPTGRRRLRCRTEAPRNAGAKAAIKGLALVTQQAGARGKLTRDILRAPRALYCKRLAAGRAARARSAFRPTSARATCRRGKVRSALPARVRHLFCGCYLC